LQTIKLPDATEETIIMKKNMRTSKLFSLLYITIYTQIKKFFSRKKWKIVWKIKNELELENHIKILFLITKV